MTRFYESDLTANPDSHTWEISSEGKMLAVEGSADQFRSWEEASQAGKKALKKLATRAGIW
jgi:hypothetical protein